MKTTYFYRGGFKIAPPGNNRSEEWDYDTSLYTTWDPSGAQTGQRALTQDEVSAGNTGNRVFTAVTIRTRAENGLSANSTYLQQPAIPASPTNAQVIAALRVVRQQVDALSRQVNALIRLNLSELDDISDT